MISLLKRIHQLPDNHINLSQPTEMPRVLFLGDSLTQGSVSFNYVEQLQRSLPCYQFINGGTNGDLAHNLLKHMRKIEALQPSIIYIMIGTNDVLSKLSLIDRIYFMVTRSLLSVPSENAYAFAVEKVIRKINSISPRSRVAFLPIPYFESNNSSSQINTYVDEYNTKLKALAIQYNITYIEIDFGLCKGNVISKSTGIRPRLLWGINIYRSAWLLFKKDLRPHEVSQHLGYSWTTDGIHLNSDIGLRIVDMLQNHIQSCEDSGR